MILIIYGTRPEYIKVSPLFSAFKKEGISFRTLFTGQHKDIAPTAEYSIEIAPGNNRLDSIIASCMNIDDNIFEGVSYILVQGDTTSTVGLALAAIHRKIKVIHLEAGLRSYDKNNPYPEEYNRRIVSTLADIHLCPTENSAKNLEKEGIIDNVFVTGNTVLDTLVGYKERCIYKPIVLVTMHRRENHEIMDKWFKEIDNLAQENPQLKFILPLHPNPNVQKHKNILKHVIVLEPLSHKDLLEILINTTLVITDSGGIQEESSFFNKKCLVCRKTTERPESIGLNTFLVKTPEKLKGLFYLHLKNYSINLPCPYGDGHTAFKISKILKNFIAI